jgi:hypothetical protein
MPLLLRVDAERMEGYWSVAAAAAAARDLSGTGVVGRLWWSNKATEGKKELRAE